MKLLTCPVNGARPVSEFTYWGEIRPAPDADACSDHEWADYVFNRNGAPGVKREWWYHKPSRLGFVFERDTATDFVHSIELATKVSRDERV